MTELHHRVHIATALYAVATTVHFAHNALFLDQYPNMPAWFTPLGVLGALATVHVLGVIGVVFALLRMNVLALGFLGAYAAFGFDGLAHYAVAPFASHTFTMNATILIEVGSALVLFVLVAHSLLAKRAHWHR
ncbi:MAG: hypothetical protein AAFX85_00240 [Pseudomonadota bacterium]